MSVKSVCITAAVRIIYIFDKLLTFFQFSPELLFPRLAVGSIARIGEKLISGEMVIRYAAYRKH